MKQELSISVNQALIIVFALGITVGFAGGVLTEKTGLTGSTIDKNLNVNDGTNADPDNSNNQNSGDTQAVRLQTTDFPYEGVEAGVGDANQTVNGKTYKLEGEPYIGSEDADVVMVAFEDFQCPYCNKYNNQAYKQIVSDYIKTGQVQYYYKHFPLSRYHPWATRGGVASECALNQDPEAFWTYKNGFFSNQDQLNSVWEQDPSLFDKTMKTWAEQIGLDTQKFNQCYDNREEMEEVRQDQKQGVDQEVSGTPTVFVGDQKLAGAQPYSQFSSAIESQK